MAGRHKTIWQLVESCAKELTGKGLAPFSRGDLIKCVQSKSPQYGANSINPIIQGLTDNLRGGAPGAVGKKILHSVARGQFVLYRYAYSPTVRSSQNKERAASQVPARHSTLRALSQGGLPKLQLEETLFVLPCSGTKIPGGTSRDGASIMDILPTDMAQELREQRSRNAPVIQLDHASQKQAVNRYGGKLYQIGRGAIGDLMASGARVLILSGGYGVVLAEECIGTYDAQFDPSMWPDRVVERCLATYAKEVGTSTVIGVMSSSTGYAQVFRRTKWPSIVSRVILATPERSSGAMVKAPRAQGEALVAISNDELTENWRSSDGLAMKFTKLETS